MKKTLLSLFLLTSVQACTTTAQGQEDWAIATPHVRFRHLSATEVEMTLPHPDGGSHVLHSATISIPLPQKDRLRGCFLTLNASMDPSEVAGLLNRFIGPVVQIEPHWVKEAVRVTHPLLMVFQRVDEDARNVRL